MQPSPHDILDAFSDWRKNWPRRDRTEMFNREMTQQESDYKERVDSVLRWFQYGHLPEGLLQRTSKRFAVMAIELAEQITYSDQLLEMLYALLAAKDAAVRAAILHQEQEERT